MNQGLTENVLQNYNPKKYFTQSQSQEVNSLEKIDYRKMDPLSVTSLSSKLGVHPLRLIEEGMKVVNERMTIQKVYSASIQLDLDRDLILAGKDLVKRVGDQKKAYQGLIDEIQQSFNRTLFDSFKDELLDYKKRYEDISIKLDEFDGENSALKAKVEKRVVKDRLQTVPLQSTVESLAVRYCMDPIQVLSDLNTFHSNTAEISEIPADYQRAKDDAETLIPYFCYYFSFLCYLRSEKVVDSYYQRSYFYGYYLKGDYNFVDNELTFDEKKQLLKLDDLKKSHTIRQIPLFSGSDIDSNQSL